MIDDSPFNTHALIQSLKNYDLKIDKVILIFLKFVKKVP
jgi:hypothetical protein